MTDDASPDNRTWLENWLSKLPHAADCSTTLTGGPVCSCGLDAAQTALANIDPECDDCDDFQKQIDDAERALKAIVRDPGYKKMTRTEVADKIEAIIIDL